MLAGCMLPSFSKLSCRPWCRNSCRRWDCWRCLNMTRPGSLLRPWSTKHSAKYTDLRRQSFVICPNTSAYSNHLRCQHIVAWVLPFIHFATRRQRNNLADQWTHTMINGRLPPACNPQWLPGRLCTCSDDAIVHALYFPIMLLALSYDWRDGLQYECHAQPSLKHFSSENPEHIIHIQFLQLWHSTLLNFGPRSRLQSKHLNFSAQIVTLVTPPYLSRDDFFPALGHHLIHIPRCVSSGPLDPIYCGHRTYCRLLVVSNVSVRVWNADRSALLYRPTVTIRRQHNIWFSW